MFAMVPQSLSTVLGLGGLASGGLYSWASGLYSYNRDAWMNDMALRQTRRYQQENLNIASETMHREDVRDLVQSKITVLNNFILLQTLILGLAVSLLLDSVNLPEQTAAYVVNAYIICLASSLLLLVIAIITAVMAAHLANNHAAELLLTQVRPAWSRYRSKIERWSRDEGTRAFDRQSVADMFRPPLSVIFRFKPPPSRAGCLAGFAKQEKKRGGKKHGSDCGGGKPEKLGYQSVLLEDTLAQGDDSSLQIEDQRHQDHWLEEFWYPCEDTWKPFSNCSNSALYFGTKNLSQALCYVCIAKVWGLHSNAWCLWAVVLAFIVINVTLSELGNWSRPVVGDRVKISMDSQEGVICQDFKDYHPFKIMYDDGSLATCRDNLHPQRFREDQVQKVNRNIWLWNLDGVAPVFCTIAVMAGRGEQWLQMTTRSSWIIAKWIARLCIPTCYMLHLLSKFHFVRTNNRAYRKREDTHDILNKEARLSHVDDCAACQFDTRGKTPLHCACDTGNVEVARFLLNNFPRAAKLDDSRQLATPLHLAAASSSRDIVELLLNDLDNEEVGVALSAVDSEGRTPLHVACSAGDPQVLEELLKRMDGCAEQRTRALALRDSSGQTPLCAACSSGHGKAAQQVLVYSRGPESLRKAARRLDGYKRAPLHYACDHGLVEAILWLMECYDSQAEALNHMDGANQTPLHIASERGHLDILQVLCGQRGPEDCTEPPEWNRKAMCEREAGKNSRIASRLISSGGGMIILLWLCGFCQALKEFYHEDWLVPRPGNVPDLSLDTDWTAQEVKITWPAPLFHAESVACGEGSSFYVGDQFNVYAATRVHEDPPNESGGELLAGVEQELERIEHAVSGVGAGGGDATTSGEDFRFSRIDCDLDGSIADISFACDVSRVCRPFVLLQGKSVVVDCLPGGSQKLHLLKKDGPAQKIVMNGTSTMYVGHSGQVVRYDRRKNGWDPVWTVAHVSTSSHLKSLGLSDNILWLFRSNGTAEGWDISRGSKCASLNLIPNITSGCVRENSTSSWVLVQNGDVPPVMMRATELNVTNPFMEACQRSWATKQVNHRVLEV